MAQLVITLFIITTLFFVINKFVTKKILKNVTEGDESLDRLTDKLEALKHRKEEKKNLSKEINVSKELYKLDNEITKIKRKIK